MAAIECIQIPLRHVGSVNVWLLVGDPLTLIDTGPRNASALAALESGLDAHGVRIEDLELVLCTHHHLDHVGLVATIQRRSGVRVAVLDALADYAAESTERARSERAFSQALMAEHGVPEQVIADNEGFWAYISESSEPFRADTRLHSGDVIRAGDRTLRAVARPGHSMTDTLFVDEEHALAFVGDHVLAGISSNTEIYPGPGDREVRPRPRASYLHSLRATATMSLEALLTGHGPVVRDHARLIGSRLAEHEQRSRRIAAVLDSGPRTAYGVATKLWPAELVREQPLLVLWEVLGHVDPMVSAGLLSEHHTREGRSLFARAAMAA
jgi:glyoxylase-like metal-dependent hydrolase (beta-lactamase superfamily II)